MALALWQDQAEHMRPYPCMQAALVMCLALSGEGSSDVALDRMRLGIALLGACRQKRGGCGAKRGQGRGPLLGPSPF